MLTFQVSLSQLDITDNRRKMAAVCMEDESGAESWRLHLDAAIRFLKTYSYLADAFILVSYMLCG